VIFLFSLLKYSWPKSGEDSQDVFRGGKFIGIGFFIVGGIMLFLALVTVVGQSMGELITIYGLNEYPNLGSEQLFLRTFITRLDVIKYIVIAILISYTSQFYIDFFVKDRITKKRIVFVYKSLRRLASIFLIIIVFGTVALLFSGSIKESWFSYAIITSKIIIDLISYLLLRYEKVIKFYFGIAKNKHY